MHAFSLCEALHLLNFDLRVITTSDYASKESCNDFDVISEFPIIRFKRFKSSLLTYILRVFRIIKVIINFLPNHVIFSGSLWYFLLLKPLFSILRIKATFILHGSEVNSVKWVDAFVIKIILSNDVNIVCISKHTEFLLKSIYGFSSKCNYYIIYNGLSESFFNKVNILNDTHLVNNLVGEPKFLTVGTVFPRKGQHLVVRAIPFLRNQFPNLKYHVVGMLRYPEKLNEEIEKYKLYDSVILHGKVEKHDDLVQYYKSSDIVFMLSENQPDGDTEGFGIALLEANALGKPVIGAKGSGIEEAVSDGFSGRLVNPFNHNEILDSIIDITNNYKEYSENAITWSKMFNWNKLAMQYEKILLDK